MNTHPVNTNLAEYYAKRAQEYERVYDKPERQPDLGRLKQALKAALRNETVLEIACGTGYWTHCLAETAAAILATDINGPVIDVAKAKRYPRDNVDFAIADCYTLAGINDGFSAAFGGFIWSHVPLEKLPSFLETLHAKVKTGGKIVFIDNAYVAGNSTPVSRTDEIGNTYQRRVLQDGSAHLVLKNFPAEAQIRSLLEGKAAQIAFTQLPYYWYLVYTVG